MKAQWTIPILVVLFLMSFLCVVPVASAEYQAHAQISYAGANGLIMGISDDDWACASVNTLVLPGDTLWSDIGGAMEVEMAGNSYLRMADGSKARVEKLPYSAHVRGWIGSFYVHRLERSQGDFYLETPACMIKVMQNSLVRFDILEDGATTVSVHWGDATVSGDRGRDIRLNRRRRLFVDPGHLPSLPVSFNAMLNDDFDVWNDGRVSRLNYNYDTIPKGYFEDSTPLGVSSLVSHGEWVSVGSANYWRPVNVVDFVPYRQGHWSYVPAVGYAWVGQQPFSYITSHYGRWTHNARHGWLWSYRKTWSPAWVASVRCGSNFVWSPLGIDNYPVVTSSAYFNIGKVRFGINSSNYCVMDELFMGPARVYSCTPTFVSAIPRHDFDVWNISISKDGFHASLYRNAIGLSHFHRPRRIVRGPTMIADWHISAPDRIIRLENRIGRQDFSIQNTQRRSLRRTSVMEGSRRSSVRSIRLNEVSGPRTRRREVNDLPKIRQESRPQSVRDTRERVRETPIPESRSNRIARRPEADIRSGSRASRTPVPNIPAVRIPPRTTDVGRRTNRSRGSVPRRPSIRPAPAPSIRQRPAPAPAPSIRQRSNPAPAPRQRRTLPQSRRVSSSRSQAASPPSIRSSGSSSNTNRVAQPRRSSPSSSRSRSSSRVSSSRRSASPRRSRR